MFQSKLKLSSDILLVSLLFAAFFVFSNFTSTETRVSDVPENNRSPLVQYGEYVFLRENCLECHTLRDENESSERISLDGYSGRRHDLWIYYVITKPRQVITSKDHEFHLLTQKRLSATVMKDIFEKNGILNRADQEVAWEEVNREADSISIKISALEESHKKRTEAVALIAFLRQIPGTPKDKKKKSFGKKKEMSN